MITHSFYRLLKDNEGKTFRFVFSDGDVVIAKLVHVDDKYEDFIFDSISSNNEHRYRRSDSGSFAGKLKELVSAQLEN